MLFSSYEFLFVFLPLVWVVYSFMGSIGAARYTYHWLFMASLLFYGWYNPKNLLLIVFSLTLNFWIGRLLTSAKSDYRKILLYFGIVLNITLLAYYKYFDFIVFNINSTLGTSIPLLNNELPLGISFFTFQQIAYLVDSFSLETQEYNFCKYGLFVSFFPQLIAGPIVHHREMMTQFQDAQENRMQTSQLAKGVYLFAIGMCKKVLIADQLSTWVAEGYASAASLGIVEAWVTSFAYTFQLYFDFSGYCDMAVGLGLMFNIQLPYNFNSPYKAVNIQDFWRRWHITLGRFLREYIYIPLGGSRVGEWTAYRNLLLVFLIGGIWHGAGWTFIFWGGLHGTALVVHQFWQRRGGELTPKVGRAITFVFCNVSWVFFRADSWHQAMQIIQAMMGVNGIHLPLGLKNFALSLDGSLPLIWIGAIFLFVFTAPNSSQMVKNFQCSKRTAVFAAALFALSIFRLDRVTEFLYFNF